jgi:hypothetical protein
MQMPTLRQIKLHIQSGVSGTSSKCLHKSLTWQQNECVLQPEMQQQAGSKHAQTWFCPSLCVFSL